MNRRGFLSLLGAAAAAPAVVKAAEPGGMEAGVEPVARLNFDESDYLFVVSDDPPRLEGLEQWIPVDKPRGLDSPAAMTLRGDTASERIEAIACLLEEGFIDAAEARKLMDLP